MSEKQTGWVYQRGEEESEENRKWRGFNANGSLLGVTVPARALYRNTHKTE